LNKTKNIIILTLVLFLTACSNAASTNIILQEKTEENLLLAQLNTPYTIVEEVQYEFLANQTKVEIAATSSRTGFSWLLSQVKSGSPQKIGTTYRVTYDSFGNVLSKVEVPGSKTIVKAQPIVFQYGATVTKGSYFYARSISRYGFDCKGCGVDKDGSSGTASGIRLRGVSVRQSDGTWKDGLTYDGYYLVASDQAFPLCTVLEISNHKFSGSGIEYNVPFKVLVVDRGGYITTNKLDLFIGYSANVNTIKSVSSAGTKVTVVGSLKWTRNSLNQRICK
jgi:3D (Asp-Asp-Asp) domain-containing protein